MGVVSRSVPDRRGGGPAAGQRGAASPRARPARRAGRPAPRSQAGPTTDTKDPKPAPPAAAPLPDGVLAPYTSTATTSVVPVARPPAGPRRRPRARPLRPGQGCGIGFGDVKEWLLFRSKSRQSGHYSHPVPAAAAGVVPVRAGPLGCGVGGARPRPGGMPGPMIPGHDHPDARRPVARAGRANFNRTAAARGYAGGEVPGRRGADRLPAGRPWASGSRRGWPRWPTQPPRSSRRASDRSNLHGARSAPNKTPRGASLVNSPPRRFRPLAVGYLIPPVGRAGPIGPGGWPLPARTACPCPRRSRPSGCARRHRLHAARVGEVSDPNGHARPGAAHVDGRLWYGTPPGIGMAHPFPQPESTTG